MSIRRITIFVIMMTFYCCQSLEAAGCYTDGKLRLTGRFTVNQEKLILAANQYLKIVFRFHDKERGRYYYYFWKCYPERGACPVREFKYDLTFNIKGFEKIVDDSQREIYGHPKKSLGYIISGDLMEMQRVD